MTAVAMFAAAFALTVAAIVTIAQPRRKRTPDAQDYAEQEERLLRAAARARRGGRGE